MKLFLTNLGKIKKLVFFPNLVSSSLKPFSHKSKFNFIVWYWEPFAAHFTPYVSQKSCVLKMADAKAFLTLLRMGKEP